MAAEYVGESWLSHPRPTGGSGDGRRLDPLPCRVEHHRMLRGISPLIGPDLLGVLYRMGHGDELVLADQHFPADTHGRRVVRCDGLRIADLLDGLLPLITLDRYVATPTVLMAPVAGEHADPAVAAGYQAVVRRHHPWVPDAAHLSREAFYERARAAFAIVVTGENTRYGNLIIRRGNDA
jgi:L-fucose mutarotase